MKISRIFLSAMILFSMQSSLFGMRATDDKGVVVVQEQTRVRRKSHDGTRDGRFGSAEDTFVKLGTSYNPLFGPQNQVYDIGSDEHAPARWVKFGETIKTVPDAEKWIDTIERKEKECPTVDWTPLQESKENAQSIIASDRHNRFNLLNTKITEVLDQAYQTHIESERYKLEQSIIYETQVAEILQKIDTIRSQQATNLAAHNQAVQEKLTTFVETIRSNVKDGVALKSEFNATRPRHPITNKLAVKADNIDKLNHAQLVKIAASAAAKAQKSCC
jgi:hypothetical protein